MAVADFHDGESYGVPISHRSIHVRFFWRSPELVARWNGRIHAVVRGRKDIWQSARRPNQLVRPVGTEPILLRLLRKFTTVHSPAGNRG